MVGGLGNDTLDSGGGADRVDGGAGNDLLIGGVGQDAASYDGKRADYKVVHDAAGWHV